MSFSGQASGVDQCEPHDIQQAQMQHPVPGLQQSPVAVQTGWCVV